MSLLTIFSLAALLLMVLSFIFSYMRRVSAGEHESHAPREIDEIVSKRAAENVAVAVNQAIFRINNILRCDDLVLCGKVAVALAVTSAMGALLSGATLLYFAFLGAFLGPVVYQRKQAEIDAAIKRVQAEADKLTLIAKREISVKAAALKEQVKAAAQKKAL